MKNLIDVLLKTGHYPDPSSACEICAALGSFPTAPEVTMKNLVDVLLKTGHYPDPSSAKCEICAALGFLAISPDINVAAIMPGAEA